MENKIIYTNVFARDAKHLLRKFKTLETSLFGLEEKLLRNPRLGDAYGSNIYKIRLSDESKGKGKSGGFRVIYYLVEEHAMSSTIFMITIFDKSEESTLKKQEVLNLLKKCGLS